jgi:hypothetical protein
MGGAPGAGKVMAGKPLGAAPKLHEAAKPLYPNSPFGPQRPGAPSTQTEALRQTQDARRFGQGYGNGEGGFGYGVPGVYPEQAGYDPRSVPPEGFAPQYGNGYEVRPPQLTCFRPRLIVFGGHPTHAQHLPKVVYGGPLPCGFKGV